MIPLCCAAAAALAPSCTRNAGSSDWPSGDPYQVTTNVWPSRGPKIDLLFMLNNASSSAPERESLRQYFPNLAQQLQGHDLHIGIITSDLGAGIFMPPSCDSIGGDQGMLQNQRNGMECSTAGLLDPEARFLAYAPAADGGSPSVNYAGTLEEAFACHAAIREGSCVFVHPLASVRAALEGCGTPGGCVQPANEGFLRPDATLAVVMLTDEDDCSAPPDSTLFDPSQHTLDSDLGPLGIYRCFEFGSLCDGADPDREAGARENCAPGSKDPDPLHQLTAVENFAAFLTALKPDPGSLYLAVIAGPPTPVKVGLDANGGPMVQPSCSGATGSARPALRLSKLVSLLPPERSRFFSICGPDMQVPMAAIGSDLATSSVCLSGWLRDAESWSGASPDCAIEDRVPIDGSLGAYERSSIPRCETPQQLPQDAPDTACPFALPAGETACWFAVYDSVCAQFAATYPSGSPPTSSGTRLKVQRTTADGACSTAAAPERTITVAQCVTCGAHPTASVYDCSPGCMEHWPGCCPDPTPGCWP